MNEQNICIDCFKDTPVLATLIQDNPKEKEGEKVEH
jgi:hypothetical protein